MHPPQGTVIFADNKLFSFLRYRSCRNNISTFPLRFAARSLHTSAVLVSIYFCMCDVRSPFYYYLLLLLGSPFVVCFFSLFATMCLCKRAQAHCALSTFLCFALIFFAGHFFCCRLPRFNFSFSCALCTVTSIL